MTHNQEMTAVAMAIDGKPQNEVANTLNVNQSTISRLNSKHKDLILAKTAQIFDEALEPTTNRLIKEMKIADKFTDDELKKPENQFFLTRADKRADIILKAAGIAPSNQSIHIQQIFNDNSKTLISAQVADLLGDQLDGIIDAEYEEIGEDNE